MNISSRVVGGKYYEFSVDKKCTGLLNKKESLEFARILISQVEDIMFYNGVVNLEEEISTVGNVLDWLIKEADNENK